MVMFTLTKKLPVSVRQAAQDKPQLQDSQVQVQERLSC